VPSTYLVADEPNWAGALDAVNLKPGVPAPAFLDSPQTDSNGTGAWLVIELVRKQQQPLTAQVAIDIQEYLVSQHSSLFEKEQSTLLHKASVTVDPEYGTWVSSKTGNLPGVFPPSTPSPKFLLNRSVDKASS
jgi:hypothetical protein